MKPLTLAVLSAASLAASAAGAAAPPGQAGPAAPGAAGAAAPAAPSPDAQFVTQAGQFDVYEQLAAQLVISYGRNAAVKDYAASLIVDHGRTSADMAGAATAAGLPTSSPGISPAQQAMIDALRNAPADQIDRLFVTQQMQAQTTGLALLNGYSGANAGLRAAAQRAAAVLQGRQARLQALSGQV